MSSGGFSFSFYIHTALGDIEKFVETFSRKETTPHTRKSSLDKPHHSTVRPITLLDGKRSQASYLSTDNHVALFSVNQSAHA